MAVWGFQQLWKLAGRPVQHKRRRPVLPESFLQQRRAAPSQGTPSDGAGGQGEDASGGGILTSGSLTNQKRRLQRHSGHGVRPAGIQRRESRFFQAGGSFL